MANLRSRGLLFAFVAVAAVLVAVVAFSDDTGEHAEAAQPQGLPSYDFGCQTLGMTMLLLDTDQPADYFCMLESENWECEFLQGDIVTCSAFNAPDHQWTCAEFPDGGAADCSDEGSGSYYCADVGGSVSCTTDSDTMFDFEECAFNSQSYGCSTGTTRMACAVIPPQAGCGFRAGIIDRPWGDVDCNGAVGARDNQAVLRAILGQPALSQTEPCPDVSGGVFLRGAGEAVAPVDYPDPHFGCVVPGIAEVLLDLDPADYNCNYQGGWGCDVSDNVRTVLCISGLVESECGELSSPEGAADCEDNFEGSHFCGGINGQMDCYNAINGENFDDCRFDGDTLTCSVTDRELLCVDQPPFSHWDCVITDGVAALWADVDCSGSIGARDNQALLRNVLGQAPLSQTEPCADVGDGMSVTQQ